MYDSGHRSDEAAPGAGDGHGGEGRVAGGPVPIAVACTGAFLAFLDATIVNIAFPDISASFPDSSRAALSWVLDGYFVVIAALLLPAGGLADRFGHKRVFGLGVAVFTLASVLCAAAPTLPALIAARVIQGVGAALIVPASLALVLDRFPVERRAAGVGLWGAAAAAAAAVGPTLGGALVELADWRLVFLVNLPLGVAVLLAAARRLTETAVRVSHLPDLPAAGMLALALGLVTLAIVEGNDWGWAGTPTLACAAAGALLLATVAVRSRTHPRPLLDSELFAHASFRTGNLGTLLFSAAFFSLILGNVLFLTGVWGYTVLQAALASLPSPLLSTVFAGPAGALADRFGHRVVIVPGTVLFALGVMMLRGAGAAPDYVGVWLPGACVVGIGVGLAFPTLGSASVRDVPVDRFATASAVNAAFRQVGAVLGTALLVAIVGEPVGLADSLGAADRGYLFAAVASLAAGAVALALRPAPAPAREPEPAATAAAPASPSPGRSG